MVLLFWQSWSSYCSEQKFSRTYSHVAGIMRVWLGDTIRTSHCCCLGAGGCLRIVSCLHISHLKLSPTWLGSKSLRIALVQSWDWHTVFGFWEMFSTILRLHKFLDCTEHMQYQFEFWFPLCSCVESIYCDWKFSGSLPLAKQLMLAVGDSGGALHILEVLWTLSHPSASEVSPYPSFHYSLPPAWPMTLCMQYLVSPKDNSITESIGSNVLQWWI